jgi:hypothetical protein
MPLPLKPHPQRPIRLRWGSLLSWAVPLALCARILSGPGRRLGPSAVRAGAPGNGRTAPDPGRKEHSAAPCPAIFSDLSPVYRRYLLIVGLFGIGNSSDAFLLLKAQNMGVGSESLLLMYALFNVVEATFAYQAGRLSDRVGRRPLLAAGYAVFALVYLGFALLHGPTAVWVLFTTYGLYYTLTH